MACPYFIPREPVRDDAGASRPNPPLGEFYAGACAAGESSLPLESCNFGYARGLACFPDDSQADAVRFSIEEASSELVRIRWCEERDHRPVRHGVTERSAGCDEAETGPTAEAFEAQLGAYAASFGRARAGARRS